MGREEGLAADAFNVSLAVDLAGRDEGFAVGLSVDLTDGFPVIFKSRIGCR